MTKKILVAGASGGVGRRLCVLLVKVGETFYEPTGCLHRVAKNPAAKGKTRALAVVLHPRDAKQVTIPEPKKK